MLNKLREKLIYWPPPGSSETFRTWARWCRRVGMHDLANLLEIWHDLPLRKKVEIAFMINRDFYQTEWRDFVKRWTLKMARKVETLS